MIEINKNSKVLIAPLNWGLGHASRCIPIINHFIKEKCDIIIASDGEASLLLRKEFPNLIHEDLPSYDISYPNTKNIIWHLASMSKKIIGNVDKENTFLKELNQKHNFDIIISDNRPGVYLKNVYSIYITHQTNIQAKSFSSIANKVHNYYMKRFDEIWIPDFEGENSLAGDLSIYKGQIKHKYIGPISRFAASNNYPEPNRLLFILSGPEPQRSILEELILMNISDLTEEVILVRGVVEKQHSVKRRHNLTIYNYLTSEDLENEIAIASLVVCRSGYSSIMDLHKMAKKAFFIPTPGQTEQEYLAKYLKDKGIANYIRQNNLNLSKILDSSLAYSGF